MKQILCYGDSNTWALIPGTKKRYPWGVRWTSLLQDELYKDDIRIIEEGLCGRTTIFEDVFRKYRNGLETLPFVLESQGDVDGVILMLGTNDCKSNYNNSPYKIGLGIEKCLDEILKSVPADKVLLVSPIHLGKDVWRDEYDPEFSEASVELSKKLKGTYQRIAHEKKVRFIAASDYVSPSDIDMEHLDQDGHKRFAQVVLAVIKDIFLEKVA